MTLFRYPALIVVAGVLVYANSLSGVFTFDDVAAVLENESIREIGTALSPPDRGEPVAGRPIVNLSFALNYAAHGLDVRGYHVVNIAIHVACALLLFGLVRRTLGSDHVALASALVWIVHPLLTEAVNYISQRTELLMSLFFLLTLYASVRGHAADHKGPPRKRSSGAGLNGPPSWQALAVTACALGMACKETMATAPIVVVLYDRVFRYSSFKAACRERRGLYAGLAATWVLLAALIWSGPRWETAGFATGISAWTYLLNQAVMIVEYLQRAVWPASLVLDYGEPRNVVLDDVLWQALFVVALLTATVVALVKWPPVGFAAAAFFIILAPTSSIIPIATEVGAERRMYLPLAALVVPAVSGAAHAMRMRPRPLWSAIAVAVVALSALTIQRNTDYRDEMTLWRTTLERHPQARAHRNYATMLKRAGYRDEVIAHLRQAMDGQHPEGRYALGFELYEQGRLDEAVVELQRFVREVPDDRMVSNAHALTGDALLRLGRFAEAVAEYEAVTRVRPRFGGAWANLGLALERVGQPQRAIEATRRAVEVEPGNPTSRINLAAMLLGAGDFAAAAVHAEEAARLAPSHANARVLAGVALAGLGRDEEAVAHLRAALQLDPSNPDAREQLARLTGR